MGSKHNIDVYGGRKNKGRFVCVYVWGWVGVGGGVWGWGCVGVCGGGGGGGGGWVGGGAGWFIELIHGAVTRQCGTWQRVRDMTTHIFSYDIGEQNPR